MRALAQKRQHPGTNFHSDAEPVQVFRQLLSRELAVFVLGRRLVLRLRRNGARVVHGFTAAVAPGLLGSARPVLVVREPACPACPLRAGGTTSPP